MWLVAPLLVRHNDANVNSTTQNLTMSRWRPGRPAAGTGQGRSAFVDSPTGDRLSPRADFLVDWATICTRLQRDSNDQGAWDALVLRVRPLVYAKLRGRAPDVIEDAIADMCASVVLDIEAARSPETFRGFVLGKCLNVVKGAIRTAQNERVPLDALPEMPAAGNLEPDDPRFVVLDRCLEGLPERDRRAVELRYFAEAHSEQIARELRVSEGNARRIVFNGVNRLRKCAQAAVGPLSSGMRR